MSSLSNIQLIDGGTRGESPESTQIDVIRSSGKHTIVELGVIDHSSFVWRCSSVLSGCDWRTVTEVLRAKLIGISYFGI